MNRRNFIPINLFLIVLLSSVACNNKLDCKNAIVDEKFKTMEEYNASFFDKNYTGTVIDYFDNSEESIKWIVNYKNGKITKYESFNEDGTYKVIKPIKCTSTHGNMQIFMDNNKVGYEFEYNLGRKDGIGKSYFKNGEIQKVVNYKNDLKDGNQFDLTINGDTILKQVYKKGKLISEINPYQGLKDFCYKMAKDSSEAEMMFDGIMKNQKGEPSDELKKALDNAISAEEHLKNKEKKTK